MPEDDDREPIMGLRRRPPSAEFPAAAGWAMLLMLFNAAIEIFLGLVSSAGSILLTALVYILAVGFLIFAVGLARLRGWAWKGSMGWTALATATGLAALAFTHDPRYVPVLPAVGLGVLLVPGVRRALGTAA